MKTLILHRVIARWWSTVNCFGPLIHGGFKRNTKMKRRSFTSPKWPWLTAAAFCALFAGTTRAGVVFQHLHSFGRTAPVAPLIQSRDGNLYGTTSGGGDTGDGTVYRITTNGTLTVLYSFTGGNDGAARRAGLVEARDGNLYG